AEALGVVEPVFAHLDEKEEVHLAVEHRAQFGAGTGADGLDALAALTEDDGALAGAANIDHLLDTNAAVGPLLPALGLDRRRIGQLVMELQKNLLARHLGGEKTLLRIGELVGREQ